MNTVNLNTMYLAEAVGEPAVNIAIFVGFVAVTMFVVIRASKNNNSAADFHRRPRLLRPAERHRHRR